MKFHAMQKCLKKIGYRLSSGSLVKIVPRRNIRAARYDPQTVPQFVKKLERYIQDYTEANQPTFVQGIKEILKAINENDWIKAFKTLKDIEGLRIDLPQTWWYLHDKADDQKLEQRGLSHWGEISGKYIAYRAGSIAKVSRGVFFAASYEDAEAYAKIDNEYRPVHKYLLKLEHPLVAQKQNDAIEKLGEKPIELNMHILQKHLDEQLVRLLKKKGYDSAVLLRPSLPAMREIVIVDPKSILEVLE
jgi:hypothetical protein